LPGFPFVERHLDLLEAKGSLELEFENKLRNAKSYHLTIGDMCYIALGQIVNRNYSAVYYQPSANVIINSPVVCLAVAESARKQWSSIDEPSHRESLISDLSNIAIRFRREDAITRLMYYYPDAGTWCACAELQRPFYSVYSVEDLLVELSDAVFDGFDPAAVRRILESCDEHTAAGAVERFRQGEFAWPVVAPQLAGIKPWADEILSELSATIETAPSCAISAAHQVRFVEHLIPFASPAIDNALDRVFRVALRKRSCLRYDIDHLLLACARRLIRNPSRATEIRDTIAEQAHELVSNLDDSESQ
jgi:hypothetical protein